MSSPSTKGMWFSPGSSTYVTFGRWRASQRAFSTWQIWSPTRCSTSVGVVIVGTTWRTSISNAIRMNATASCGLAP
jgi:hypothetical protein